MAWSIIVVGQLIVLAPIKIADQWIFTRLIGGSTMKIHHPHRLPLFTTTARTHDEGNCEQHTIACWGRRGCGRGRWLVDLIFMRLQKHFYEHKRFCFTFYPLCPRFNFTFIDLFSDFYSVFTAPDWFTTPTLWCIDEAINANRKIIRIDKGTEDVNKIFRDPILN